MRFYVVSGGGTTRHFSTLFNARVEVRTRIKFGRVDWRDIYVDEVEVPLDKANVLRLVNDDGGTHQYLRQWGATPRCGLKLQEREE